MTRGRPKQWIEEPVRNGVMEVRCSKWKYFFLYIQEEMLDYPSYIYRGQARDWKLLPSIDREEGGIVPTAMKHGLSRDKVIEKHLAGFRTSLCGRRPISHQKESDDELWALGAHYGLVTPLIDWSESPFVAAFFAMSSEQPPGEEYSIVWALGRGFGRVCKDIRFLEPKLDSNSRLLVQKGCFTYSSTMNDIQTIVETYCSKNTSSTVYLMKILIPASERIIGLRSLNRMTINYLSLFPDIEGSARYCNMSAVISKY